MSSISDLEKRINKIEERNQKVEKDKQWEVSFTRRALLIAFTYLSISFYLKAINVTNPWSNAVVPSLAFWLSTLTLPFFKKIWEKFILQKSKKP